MTKNLLSALIILKYLRNKVASTARLTVNGQAQSGSPAGAGKQGALASLSNESGG